MAPSWPLFAMVFSSASQASTWFGLWRRQVEACRSASDPRTAGSGTASTWVGSRRYSDGQVFKETAAVTGTTVRLYALADPAGTITAAQQRELLRSITAAG